MLPQSVSFLKLMLNSFCMINVQRRELYIRDVVNNTFRISLRLDAYEGLSFELFMMLDMTKLDILILVGMTLTLTQGHRLARKLQHVQLVCCTLT